MRRSQLRTGCAGLLAGVMLTLVPVAGPSPAAAGGDATVEIVEPDDNERHWVYRPATIAVEPGTTVIWRNAGLHTHNVIANDGSFDSGDILPGQSWRWTFSSPAGVPYHCGPHRWMRGTVNVVAGS